MNPAQKNPRLATPQKISFGRAFAVIDSRALKAVSPGNLQFLLNDKSNVTIYGIFKMPNT